MLNRKIDEFGMLNRKRNHIGIFENIKRLYWHVGKGTR